METTLDKAPKKRIFELDLIRGIAVIAMMFDHFTYLLSYNSDWTSVIFNNYYTNFCSWLNNLIELSDFFQNSTFRLAGHYIFVTLFLLLVGISSNFSHNNLKRSIKVLIAGLIVSLGTMVLSLVIDEDYYIIFGILQLIGVSILLYTIVNKLYSNKWLNLGIGIVIIIWGFAIKWYDAPRISFITDLNFERLLQVIAGYNVYGADHFGIIPCTGVVFIGAFLGEIIYPNRTTKFPKIDRSWHKPFTFVGRHALLFYVLHQVISFIIVFILFLIAGYHF